MTGVTPMREEGESRVDFLLPLLLCKALQEMSDMSVEVLRKLRKKGKHAASTYKPI